MINNKYLNKLPKVSFIIPTLNEEHRITQCLESIKIQTYPKNRIEIIINDANSTDKTVEIAKSYGARVLTNPLKTSESAKALGVRNARGEIICFIDADNILPCNDWIDKMVNPLLQDPNLIGSEALYFTYRKEDGFIDRYCALIGMNDPLCLWLGVYDRMNLITGKWTGLPVKFASKNGYIELLLEKGKIPTIGANGSMIRKTIFDENPELFGDYLFDIDILEHVVEKCGSQKFAKVNIGVIHLYSGSSIKRFAKKQLRRVKDFLYRRHLGQIFVKEDFSNRKYSYGQGSSKDLIIKISLFILSCIFIFPLILQSIKGYRNKPDRAWLAHPLLCWITLLVYTYGSVESLFHREELSRDNW